MEPAIALIEVTNSITAHQVQQAEIRHPSPVNVSSKPYHPRFRRRRECLWCGLSLRHSRSRPRHGGNGVPQQQGSISFRHAGVAQPLAEGVTQIVRADPFELGGPPGVPERGATSLKIRLLEPDVHGALRACRIRRSNRRAKARNPPRHPPDGPALRSARHLIALTGARRP